MFTCSGVGFEGLVPRQTLAGLVVSVHQGVVGAGGVWEVVAVVVREAGVLERHHLPDGVVAAPGLGDPHVALLHQAQYFVKVRVNSC